MIGKRRRNPLRRTSDRLESLLLFLVVFTFLAGAPLVAWWTGTSTYRSQVRAERWEQAHLFPVDAILVESAGGPATERYGTVAPDTARATWAAPDGSARSGLVPIAAGDDARAGSRVAIWVDDAGGLRSPPLDRNPVTRGILTGMAVTFCVAAGLTGAYRFGRALLDRRRDRAWTRAWCDVGPRWTRDSGRF